jgi:hypothetical protein
MKKHCDSAECGTPVEYRDRVSECDCMCEICVSTWSEWHDSLTQAVWMERFYSRASRLKHLVELDAPTVIVENEKNMVLYAFIRLSPKNVMQVLLHLPEGIKKWEDALKDNDKAPPTH